MTTTNNQTGSEMRALADMLDQKRKLFESVQHKRNWKYWKYPTTAKQCASRAEAEALAEAIIFYCGGAEISHDNIVVSRGYYYYVGA